MSRLVILGAGGHGAVCAEAAAAMGAWAEIVFLDDSPPGNDVVGFRVEGGFDAVSHYASGDSQAIVAVGDNRRRLHLTAGLQEAGIEVGTIVHPAAIVSPSASLAAGVVVFAGSVVNARASIGVACIINTSATIDHDCHLDSGVHVSPGAHLAGTVSVGECSWVGVGASVRDGVRIGQDVIVGAGAAVISDIPRGKTVVGVPARPRATSDH